MFKTSANCIIQAAKKFLGKEKSGNPPRNCKEPESGFLLGKEASFENRV